MTKKRKKLNPLIQLTVDTDIIARVIKFKQEKTYAGLLVGQPTKQINDAIIDNCSEEAKKFCSTDAFYLIEPERDNLTDIPFIRSMYPKMDIERMPRIKCTASIEASYTKDSKKDFSALGLVWFQDDYLFPPEAEILEQFKAIPYRKYSKDYYL